MSNYPSILLVTLTNPGGQQLYDPQSSLETGEVNSSVFFFSVTERQIQMTEPYPSFGVSDLIGEARRKPRLRSLRDRLRQIAMYELGGLVVISPVFAVAMVST